MKSYDIIVPVGRKDVKFTPRVVSYLIRCLSDVDTIYLITQYKYIKYLTKKTKSYGKCKVLDENQILKGLTFDRIKDLIKERSPKDINLTGWYFQQFLKLGFALSNYSKKYFLSWDADTLPLAPITFFSGDHILFNPKSENHKAYFETLSKLMGFGRVSDCSFISESMLFSVEIVSEMIADIERSPVLGTDWISKIIYACDIEGSKQSFSEFETYGNYCAVKFPGLYQPRHLNTFREAGMICGRYISDKKLRKMSFDVDMASFEMSDMPMFPYNIPNMIWEYCNIIHKVRTLTLKEVVTKLINKNNRGQSLLNEGYFRLPD